MFMRALPELLKRRPHARVLIVGGNEVGYGAAPIINKSWKEIFIEEVRPHIDPSDWQRVHFFGRVPYEQFISVLQISTIHVYLTYPFVLSWSLIEAMAARCCIVGSATPPVEELLQDSHSARLVDFFDVSAQVRVIGELFDDPGERHRLADAAAQKARDYSSLDGLRRWLELIEL